jgi:hypothetical protein
VTQTHTVKEKYTMEETMAAKRESAFIALLEIQKHMITLKMKNKRIFKNAK